MTKAVRKVHVAEEVRNVCMTEALRNVRATKAVVNVPVTKLVVSVFLQADMEEGRHVFQEGNAFTLEALQHKVQPCSCLCSCSCTCAWSCSGLRDTQLSKAACSASKAMH